MLNIIPDDNDLPRQFSTEEKEPKNELMLGDTLQIKRKISLKGRKRPSMIFSQQTLDKLKDYDSLYKGQKTSLKPGNNNSDMKQKNSTLIEKATKTLNIFQVVS